jgi:hypothetical protein
MGTRRNFESSWFKSGAMRSFADRGGALAGAACLAIAGEKPAQIMTPVSTRPSRWGRMAGAFYQSLSRAASQTCKPCNTLTGRCENSTWQWISIVVSAESSIALCGQPPTVDRFFVFFIFAGTPERQAQGL